MDKLLPVAIMAHNEGKVIQKSVESVLDQNTPIGYTVKVVIVANGCSDRTEGVVRDLEGCYPNRVVLVSMKEKGKTKAINRAIEVISGMENAGVEIPYVIFLDADCEFYGRGALVKFVKEFRINPKLCAVAADCLPDVFFNSRKDIVAQIYRAIYRLSESLRINAISGMCYGIRFDILKQIDFPNFQLSDSMYVTSRLDGWFFRNKDIKIIFKAPFGLRKEILRRTRQEVSNQRYHEYYSYLKGKGIKSTLFETPLGDDYKWRGAMDGNIFKEWLKLRDNKARTLIILFYLISIWSQISASVKVRRMEITDIYWEVER